MADGYDQGYEDRLFERIRWPHAGYRLFEIGHFVGDRDWFDGLWESNCMFVERPQLEQVGVLRRAVHDGGGWLRQPRALRAARLLTRHPSRHHHRRGFLPPGARGHHHEPDRSRRTTGPACSATARTTPMLRGRAFKGPGKPIHYVGRISPEAARRIEAAPHVDRACSRRRPRPAGTVRRRSRCRCPRSCAGRSPRRCGAPSRGRSTSWLGRAIATRTDRPPRVPGAGEHGPARLDRRGRHRRRGPSAVPGSMCELVGHGQVVSIDVEPPRRSAGPPSTADPTSGEPLEHRRRSRSVRELVGAAGRWWCSARCADRATTVQQFNPTRRSCRSGSYVVVTDTIVNGHPVWPASGRARPRASSRSSPDHGEFVADPLAGEVLAHLQPGWLPQAGRPVTSARQGAVASLRARPAGAGRDTTTARRTTTRWRSGGRGRCPTLVR